MQMWILFSKITDALQEYLVIFFLEWNCEKPGNGIWRNWRKYEENSICEQFYGRLHTAFIPLLLTIYITN